MIQSGPFLRFDRVSQAVWGGSVLIVTSSNQSACKPTTLVIKSSSDGINNRFEFNALQLDTWGESVFWRFDVQVPMLPTQSLAYTYSIVTSVDQQQQQPFADDNQVSQHTFHVPALDDPQWHWAFTSCNGFSMGVSDKRRQKMGGLGSMWTDMLRHHDTLPFHCMVGGGDQLYCDAVWKLPRLQLWLATKGKQNRNTAPWSDELETDLNQFYFSTYVNHFLDPAMRSAYARIPTINMLDDHDIWDGMGSYPEYLEKSVTFVNMKRIAYRYYLLFQHHTTPAMAVDDHFIGVERNSYSLITQLGPSTAILLLDARSERTQTQVISQESYDQVFAKLEQDMPLTTRHLVLVTGVPLIYPRMESAETILNHIGRIKLRTTRAFNTIKRGVKKGVRKVFGEKAASEFDSKMDNVKMALGKSGMMKSVLNQFGEPELADDLIDHWTNVNHNAERQALILRLQKLSMERRVRVTLIAGDVHCAAVGRFASKDGAMDHHLMYQIISSAIVNVPPPNVILRRLHGNSKVISFDDETQEEMVDLFTTDVNGKKLSRHKLMGRRNWCDVVGDSAVPGSLVFSIQVENVVWSDPSVAYPVSVPAMP